MSEITPDAWKYKVVHEQSGGSYWRLTTDKDEIDNGGIFLSVENVKPLYDGETVAQILNEESNVELPKSEYPIPLLNELETHDPEEFYD